MPFLVGFSSSLLSLMSRFKMFSCCFYGFYCSLYHHHRLMSVFYAGTSWTVWQELRSQRAAPGFSVCFCLVFGLLDALSKPNHPTKYIGYLLHSTSTALKHIFPSMTNHQKSQPLVITSTRLNRQRSYFTTSSHVYLGLFLLQVLLSLSSVSCNCS